MRHRFLLHALLHFLVVAAALVCGTALTCTRTAAIVTSTARCGTVRAALCVYIATFIAFLAGRARGVLRVCRRDHRDCQLGNNKVADGGVPRQVHVLEARVPSHGVS